jgi:transposase
VIPAVHENPMLANAKHYKSSHKWYIFENHDATVDLTDEQWIVISPLIPDPPKRPDSKGRPWKDSRRDIMNGVLYGYYVLEHLGMSCQEKGTLHFKYVIVDFSNGFIPGYLKRYFKRYQLTYASAEDWIYQNVT